MSFRVSKEIEFDAGHRVPDHASKCRNPHGHRYKVQVVVGASDLVSSGSASGMVLDFGDIKNILIKKVHDPLDHGFIVYEADHVLLTPLVTASASAGWKIICFPYIPTAENIARWVWEEIEDSIRNSYNDQAYLDTVRVYETPTSWADYGG